MITNLNEILQRLKSLNNTDVDLILYDSQVEFPCYKCKDKFDYCSCKKPKQFGEILKIIGKEI